MLENAVPQSKTATSNERNMARIGLLAKLFAMTVQAAHEAIAQMAPWPGISHPETP
jgi:hypothetical protein